MGMAAVDGNIARFDSQRIREKLANGGVGPAVFGRGGNADFQSISKQSTDLAAGRTGDSLNPQQYVRANFFDAQGHAAQSNKS
jgi:hypothetical protein